MVRVVLPSADVFAAPTILAASGGALVVPIVPEAGGGWGVALVGTGDTGNEVTLLVGPDRARAAELAGLLNRAG